MTRRWLTALCPIVVAIPVLAVISFITLESFSGGAAGGTLATGRSVMTYSDSLFLSSELRGDTATIKTGGKTIIVKPTALFVDGSSVATIDEKVSDVEVRVKDGTIRFLADGEMVTPTMR